MSINDFIQSIFKHKRIFAFLVALSIVLCSMGIKLTESNTAEIIIKYICDSAEDGLTENGQKINPYEINSPLVIKNTVDTLGLKNANTESISRNISVTPIIPTSEQQKYASWIDKFSDYAKNEDDKKHTVYYSVKYTTTAGKDYAKRILSALINQYSMYYVEKYTYSNDITKLSGEAAMEYDYYDTVSLLRDKINSNMEYLASISSSENDYRSPRTGYSLMDLSSEYKSLLERDLSVSERMIIENGITKNAWYLRNSIQDKMVESQYDSELNAKKADTQRNLMSIYSQKNKQYLWDENDRYKRRYNRYNDEGESEQVRENVERDDYYSQVKSVYDKLVLDYVQFRSNALNSDIDRKRYENDINSFPDGFSNDPLEKELQNRLQETCNKFNALYSLTKDTIDDYNTYKSAKSIECISGVVAHKATSTVFYYTMSIVIALMLGFILSALLVYMNKKEETNEEADENAESEKNEA